VFLSYDDDLAYRSTNTVIPIIMRVWSDDNDSESVGDGTMTAIDDTVLNAGDGRITEAFFISPRA
jgi:hypothetical protein